jgi:hypothetical protein
MTRDASRRDAGNAAEEDPPSALGLLEVVRSRLRRQAARDLAHGREQGERAAIRLHGLVRDRGDSGVDERARERLVGGDVEVREERETLSQTRVLGSDRLLDLQQEVGARPDLVDRGDGRSRALVRFVREGTADPGARLDDYLMPAEDELSRAGRR